MNTPHDFPSSGSIGRRDRRRAARHPLVGVARALLRDLLWKEQRRPLDRLQLGRTIGRRLGAGSIYLGLRRLVSGECDLPTWSERMLEDLGKGFSLLREAMNPWGLVNWEKFDRLRQPPKRESLARPEPPWHNLAPAEREHAPFCLYLAPHTLKWLERQSLRTLWQLLTFCEDLSAHHPGFGPCKRRDLEQAIRAFILAIRPDGTVDWSLYAKMRGFERPPGQTAPVTGSPRPGGRAITRQQFQTEINRQLKAAPGGLTLQQIADRLCKAHGSAESENLRTLLLSTRSIYRIDDRFFTGSYKNAIGDQCATVLRAAGRPLRPVEVARTLLPRMPDCKEAPLVAACLAALRHDPAGRFERVKGRGGYKLAEWTMDRWPLARLVEITFCGVHRPLTSVEIIHALRHQRPVEEKELTQLLVADPRYRRLGLSFWERIGPG